jgi:hypothetical protein
MDFSGICLEIGFGAAIGMLVGTTGLEGSARGRITLLGAVIALVVGFVLAGIADVSGLVGAVACLLGAVIACIVVSDVVYGAGRRQGSKGGALAFIVSVAALVVVGITLLVNYLGLIVIAVLLWFGFARHRRAQRKHAGLRVLR